VILEKTEAKEQSHREMIDLFFEKQTGHHSLDMLIFEGTCVEGG
jgi:hypothetical protein